jgi:hypothetical protein
MSGPDLDDIANVSLQGGFGAQRRASGVAC